MLSRRSTMALLALLATLYVSCGGAGDRVVGSTTGGGTTGSSGGGGGADGGAGAGGAGGSGGSTGSSLSMAHFRTLAVTVSPAQGGTVSDNLATSSSGVQACASCAERYRKGVTVVLTAAPAPGFAFARWQGGPCDGGSTPACDFRIEESARITAIFDGVSP